MRAAIFDLDGVIVDTAKYHFQAWSELARELGYTLAPEVNERVKGVSRGRSLQIVLEAGGLADRFGESDRARMAERKNRRYVELIGAMDKRELLPGAAECLGAWRAAGVRTALGSASRNAPLILDALGIRAWFDTVVDGSVVTSAKPDPEVFLVAALRLGADPAGCVVLEDAVAGIQAAHRAGMYAVGVGRPEVLTEANEVIPGLHVFRALGVRPA